MTTHLFIGDSITDVDRRVDPEELGFGYVRLIAQQTGDHVVNRGVGGDRAIDLEARWEADVLTTTPDTLTVYVGINDTWQRVVGGPETTAATFEATFRRLLSRLPGDVRLVLMEPFVVPVSRDQESWYHDLGPKQRVVRALAEEFGAVFIPLQSVMTQAAAESSASAIAYDGVHPTDRGHELIAAAWLHGTRTWTGRFIAPVQNFPEAPRLRKEFTLDAGHGAIRSAELALSALGVQETWLNGERVGDDLLEPGWTSYEWRIGYRRYDVTAQLADANVLGMVVGNGWYRGHLGWESRSAVYGDRIAGFAELRVVFADGHRQVVATDESWTCSPSEIDSDDLYNGQAIDARRRDDAWLGPGTPPGVWSSTVAVDDVTGRLEESLLPPVRMQEAIAPVETRVLDDDRVLLDFGQNLVGWVRLTVSGASGDEVIVRHAEVLEHGELAVRPLRSAEATDRYRLSGGEDLFEPTFTWHGFRYAELRVPRDATWRAEAVVVGSLLTRTGTFHCSDPLVNRLHENVVWSTRGNFLSIPTDCPQRD
ncbi:MAG TPA: family 78 glycoside hydrolase catalytic domain, partial [Pseudolysinimonas sp.]|nr:family 78 glycoside hydrolase catalytic domain [Pseudolysinimonas sp.]